jgi:hypothetical protein
MQIMGVRRRRKQCEERGEWKRITAKAKNPQWFVTPVKEEEESPFENPTFKARSQKNFSSSTEGF